MATVLANTNGPDNIEMATESNNDKSTRNPVTEPNNVLTKTFTTKGNLLSQKLLIVGGLVMITNYVSSRFLSLDQIVYAEANVNTDMLKQVRAGARITQEC